ncbi:lipid storage droplets surface-binding protein 2-like isoform X3 [Neocloeon triangulifer]|uniref:lipid storage droplets surface-binding protein 2-like isoform X3 n=1 Tax=Neocloeon triangulifer TaxID=2078957 RepID=UPI00286EED77|nr:lipid storage droplets surface-binding protein 2-like isoform X3 [Neocloeon triangulifer]
MSSAASSETAGAPKQERKLSDTIPLEAVHRIAKLPMVESSISIANDVYSRVKESNAMINWTLSTAESTMSKAAEHAIPVAEKMEKHLKRVDSLLCSSLDYVEAKVPAVKLPPHELMEKASELKQMGAEKMHMEQIMAMVGQAWHLLRPSQPQICVTPSTPLGHSPMGYVTPPPCPPPPPPTPSSCQQSPTMPTMNRIASPNVATDAFYSPQETFDSQIVEEVPAEASAEMVAAENQ